MQSQFDSTVAVEDEILTTAQIDQLLVEAEFRLREKAVSKVGQSSESTKRIAIPKLRHNLKDLACLREDGNVTTANPESLASTSQKKIADELRPVGDAIRSKTVNDQVDSGPQWFNLPKTTVTPQLKRDLQLIELRSVLDTHRHYKKNTRKGKIPTFSQVGTVIQGPTEFYSSRINKKDRSGNFVEEAMKVEAENGKFKRKYVEIQETKTSGKRSHYKRLMQKRKKKS